MVANGKGLIAADESDKTAKKRFDSVGMECTEENRRQYRQLLMTAPGIEEYVSGVILHDETIHQKTDSGEAMPAALAKRGIIPGIKVDGGLEPLALHPDEKVTKGLDGLRERLAAYKTLGAGFAKWRAEMHIGPSLPSEAAIHANGHALARYAALCQEAEIVPIVEPEMSIEGDHSIERCYEVSVAMLKSLFVGLADQGVMPEGVILKASMVIAGKQAAKQSTPQEVADWTLKALKECVPANLGGVVFLSGGQGDEQATENLNAMNKVGGAPWPLSFSYSRAIQNPVLKLWAQDPKNNIAKAQAALLFRCKMNSLAAQGKYSSEMEKERGY